MPRQPHLVIVRDPRDSVWQSVVERVARRQAEPSAAGKALATARGPAAGRPPLDALVQAADAAVFERDEMLRGRIPESLSPPADPPLRASGARKAAVGGLDAAKRCASLALRLAKARVFGAAEQVEALQNAFNFNVCDPFWAECIEEYVSYFRLHGGAVPYRAGLNNLLATSVSAQARIALFGDWGTGTGEAVDLLRQIKTLAPDLLIHLGDVYYSGTQDEMAERFVDVFQTVFDAPGPACFSLCGNHDVYSGGGGYYWLVDRLGQGASYFAIRNDDWLFIAMDTGLHDDDPFRGGSTATYLEQTEAEWINGLVAGREGRKVVFLSHHPPFSAYDPIDGAETNPYLLGQLRPSLADVAAWFWGHEHRLAVYDPFQGVERGRCLGHAAVPVFADAEGDPPRLEGVPVHRVHGKPLEMGVEDGIFKHGFAIMTLSQRSATVAYYRQGESNPLWEETF